MMNFELEHLNKIKKINEQLNIEVKCNENNKCNLCLLYGIGSCNTVPIYKR